MGPPRFVVRTSSLGCGCGRWTPSYKKLKCLLFLKWIITAPIHLPAMRFAFLPAALALASGAAAVGVVGSAEGFAKGVTGGGSATPVYPSTTDELVSYLEDDEARVIVLNKE